MSITDYRLSDFDFTLPPQRIATAPTTPRDACRLLVVPAQDTPNERRMRESAMSCEAPRNGEDSSPNRALNVTFEDRIFRDIGEYLRKGDVLVVNDSRVIPARLFAQKGDSHIELLLHKPLPEMADGWRCFARPARKLKPGDKLNIADGFTATVEQKYETGEVALMFHCARGTLGEALNMHGHMPLPPYIERADEAADKTDYQTVYAAHDGSVAAPTAGLHFTQTLLATLAAQGVSLARLTLHVGAGTFQPVKVENLAEHVMHSEWAELSAETAAQLNAARAGGGRIIAVGTTALRTLESAADATGTIHPMARETDIFITPGYQFRAVDGLITNFHLPKSTLFMLVSAFCGLARMQAAYAHAIAHHYRFYSYGDACLLWR